MLKKRIAAALPVHHSIVVQSIGFNTYLPVGKPEIAIEFLNQWGIDEIMLMDITARKNSKSPDFDLVKRCSEHCLVPLTVGGGINTLADVEKLMACGADKISVNQALFLNPAFITDIARAYGDQCAVVSIDVIKTPQGFMVYDYLSGKPKDITAAEAAVKAAELGAGELFVNSVNRDGRYNGYEIALYDEICSRVHIPVLACGGAKDASDMYALLQQTSVSAACAGNFFHFTEHSVNITKSILKKQGTNIRLETHADYLANETDSEGRIIKKDDKTLEELLYIKIQKEVI